VQELLQCYADCGYDPEIWPRTARSIASGLYTRELGLPWIATMPGHAGRQHAANEFITIKGYRTAIAFAIRLLWRLGNARPDVA
jgi:acetylornithine deacetylase/succinyl-diaminopimelate desuccinylase-like protein